MGTIDPNGLATPSRLLFEPTYRIDQGRLEVEREEMFEHEQSFALHDAADPGASIDTARLGHTRLFRVQSTGHTVRLYEPDHVSVLLIRRGRMVLDTERETFTAAPGDLLLFTPNARTTHVLPNGRGQFESHCALIRTEALSETSQALRGSPIETRFNRTAPAPRAQGLARLFDHLFAEGSDPSSILGESRPARDAADILICEMLDALLREVRDLDPDRKRPSPRDQALVRQAEDLMRERYREAISTRELATSLSVTPRRLQVAFENVCDTTPLSRLQSVRLEMARERLSSAGDNETTTAIAIDCGFSHLGRFSRAYAKAFGELPSRTLRRSRT